MVFATSSESIQETTFKGTDERDVFTVKPIDRFLGVDNSANILAMKKGQLIKNKNMEYHSNGKTVFLKTKRGSTLIEDITNRTYGACVYKYNLSSTFLIFIDSDGELKSYDISSDTTSASLATKTTTIQNNFVPYGQTTIAALYISNNSDGVFKVSGATPVHAAIASSPNLDAMAFSTISKRMFGAFQHTVHWTDIQTSGANLTNIETWDTTTNLVSPDEGTGITAIAELNTIIYYFKDTGIWAHINPTEAITDWHFPKVSADTGTLSPKTVKLVQYGERKATEGIIFLGSDKTLRAFFGTIETNAGKVPSISNKESFTISDTFQDLLTAIPDSLLSEVTATYHDRKYILNIPKDSNSTEIDFTITIYTNILLPLSRDKDEEIAQPFWFESVNMDYNDFAKDKSANVLYGFNKNGFIAKVLDSTKLFEEFPTRVTLTEATNDSGGVRQVAIEYQVITGWIKFDERLLLLKGFSLFWKAAGGWSITASINSFKKDQIIPDFDDGLTTSVSPANAGGWGAWSVSKWDDFLWSGTNTNVAQRVRLKNRGHWFNFGFSHIGLGEISTIYSIQPDFKIVRNDPIGKR